MVEEPKIVCTVEGVDVFPNKEEVVDAADVGGLVVTSSVVGVSHESRVWGGGFNSELDVLKRGAFESVLRTPKPPKFAKRLGLVVAWSFEVAFPAPKDTSSLLTKLNPLAGAPDLLPNWKPKSLKIEFWNQQVETFLMALQCKNRTDKWFRT